MAIFLDNPSKLGCPITSILDFTGARMMEVVMILLRNEALRYRRP